MSKPYKRGKGSVKAAILLGKKKNSAKVIRSQDNNANTLIGPRDLNNSLRDQRAKSFIRGRGGSSGR